MRHGKRKKESEQKKVTFSPWRYRWLDIIPRITPMKNFNCKWIHFWFWFRLSLARSSKKSKSYLNFSAKLRLIRFQFDFLKQLLHERSVHPFLLHDTNSNWLKFFFHRNILNCDFILDGTSIRESSPRVHVWNIYMLR